MSFYTGLMIVRRHRRRQAWWRVVRCRRTHSHVVPPCVSTPFSFSVLFLFGAISVCRGAIDYVRANRGCAIRVIANGTVFFVLILGTVLG